MSFAYRANVLPDVLEAEEELGRIFAGFQTEAVKFRPEWGISLFFSVERSEFEFSLFEGGFPYCLNLTEAEFPLLFFSRRFHSPLFRINK